MNFRLWMAGTGLLLALHMVATAATPGGSGSRDSMIQSDDLSDKSVGISYAIVERGVKKDDGTKQVLKANVYGGEFGLDILRWLTIFGTVGASEAKFSEEDSFNSARIKYSGCAKINWWHYDIKDPTFMAGRISFKSVGEYGHSESGSDREAIKWNEIYVDLALNYELFVERMKDQAQYPYSLNLFVGPAFSKIDLDNDNNSYKQNSDFGFVGGADIYFSHNLSLGGQIQHYDKDTFSISLRYHF
jgi:hypothetical protein